MFERKQLDTIEEISYEYGLTNLNMDLIVQFLKDPNCYNPLKNRLPIEIENPGLRELFLMYDPDYLYYTAKMLLNVELPPLQATTLREFWTHAFPMFIGSRGAGKTFIIAVYSLLRAILFPGTKIVITGAAFRQGKYVYDYIENIWRNAPVAQSLFKGHQPSARLPDMWKFSVGPSQIIITPVGTGDKIRGLRANTIISDEFNSINPEIYEVVISQFAAVSSNVLQNIKLEAQKRIMDKYGIAPKYAKKNLSYFDNQSIICGTMKFEYEPMAMYWRKYKNIIESKGQCFDQTKEEEKDQDWKRYSIVRIPVECIPPGYMDRAIISRSKATMHSEYYKAEYHCIPISDTDGFFKRSLIERCTAKPDNINQPGWPAYCDKVFQGSINSVKGPRYVMGIDPASEQDNFSIVIVELYKEHQRVVYAWTTNRAVFKKQSGDDKNYYAACARKIRDLKKQFYPMIAIGCDSQGGGFAIEEALHDADKLREGESLIWPFIDLDDPKDTDNQAGEHILHMVNFSNAEWTSSSNHWMKKDMEDKTLLFPHFDSVKLGLASEMDILEAKEKEGKFYDSLEDCMLEIEALKDELSIIVRQRTLTGRERFDTPEVTTGRNKKSRLRKDRYSALLIANSVARSVYRVLSEPGYNVVGAVVGSKVKKGQTGQMYVGPEWYNVNPNLFQAIVR